MDPNEMTPTQYFVQKILNKQPIEPMDEVPLGPSLSDLLNTAPSQPPQSFPASTAPACTRSWTARSSRSGTRCSGSR